VVVTVNHRLNALGYLHLAELAGPAYADSGNAGLLDLVLALQWVRDNAAAFGGDAKNVTIFGESGGGAKVSSLLAMPAAKGLFHKAIIQSGPGLAGVPTAAATDVARQILAEAKIDPRDAGALQSAPADDLLKAAYAVQAKLPQGGGLRFLGPVTDGRVLPADPFTPVASPLGRDVPVMVGANKDEMTLFQAGEPWFGRLTDDQLTARVAAMPKGSAMLAALKASRPGYSPTHLASALASWSGILGGSVILADRKAAQGGAPVYAYRLDWETPVAGGALKSPHTLEIPLAFDTVATNRALVGEGEAPVKLAGLMSDAWIAFARTGNPNTAALPDWPRYETGRRPTMIFDVEPRVVNDPESEVRKVMQS
jgi:para-nitrobenzyl esterase